MCSRKIWTVRKVGFTIGFTLQAIAREKNTINAHVSP